MSWLNFGAEELAKICVGLVASPLSVGVRDPRHALFRAAELACRAVSHVFLMPEVAGRTR